MPTIKNILIFHEDGMDALVPYVAEAINEVMDCFPRYKEFFPIKNYGNWRSDNAYEFKNGEIVFKPYESIDWYLQRAKQCALIQEHDNQINASQMLNDLSHDPYAKQIPQWGIYLTKQDIYGYGAEGFALGLTKPDSFSIISTKRFVDRDNHFDLNNFITVVQHEFGHIINLTDEKRPNIIMELGPHCTNPSCVMQQRMNGDFSDVTEHRLARKAHGLPPICPDCIQAGYKNLFKVYANSSLGRSHNNPHSMPNFGRNGGRS